MQLGYDGDRILELAEIPAQIVEEVIEQLRSTWPAIGSGEIRTKILRQAFRPWFSNEMHYTQSCEWCPYCGLAALLCIVYSDGEKACRVHSLRSDKSFWQKLTLCLSFD